MAMIDIEYRHSSEPPEDKDIRRRSTEEMSEYLRDLVCEMQMADISSKLISTEGEGPNALLINGRRVQEILDGLEIKMLETEDSCDHGRTGIVSMGRPTLDWNRDVIEDIPDVLVKNAVSKAYADVLKNRIL